MVPSSSTIQPASLQRALSTSLLSQCCDTGRRTERSSEIEGFAQCQLHTTEMDAVNRIHKRQKWMLGTVFTNAARYKSWRSRSTAIVFEDARSVSTDAGRACGNPSVTTVQRGAPRHEALWQILSAVTHSDTHKTVAKQVCDPEHDAFRTRHPTHFG